MYISYNWLKKYIPELDKHNPQVIADKLSWALAEVERIEKRGEGLNNIVVGEIIEVSDHPENTKLAVAKVKISNEETVNIVFAGLNRDYVKPGSLYPVCLDGGSVYDAQGEIKRIVKTELNGVISEGMLCSLAELGLENEKKGISLIEDSMLPGTDLTPMLKDYIFEIENKSITHRPDCFSHRGIAREIAAMFELDFAEKESHEIITNASDKLEVNILADDVCSRFTCISLTEIEVKSSPTWLKIHLYNLGLKPINNVVDVSNYIMLDIGQPMHIYDKDKFNSNVIYARKANKGEKVRAINHKEYELKTNHLVIASPEKVEGIAGIMGGSESEVTNETKNIVIESANFDMFNIRKTSMELGLQTDASIRYSRGLTNTITKEAVQDAVKIFEDICGAEVSSQLTDVIVKPENIKTLEFNLKNIKRLGGVSLDKTKIIGILNGLNIEVEGAESFPADISTLPTAVVSLKIPEYRKDLNIDQDIVEEVIRIYGYDRIKPELPSKTITPTPKNKDYEFTYMCKQALVNSGFDEVYGYSFVGSNTYKMSELKTDKLLKVINALAPELEFFRDNLLPSLIEKINLNASNFNNFGYFELARAIKRDNKAEVPLHEKKIGVLEYSSNNNSSLELKTKLSRFFRIINLVNYKLLNLNDFDKSKLEKDDVTCLNMFHPNQTALIIFDKKVVGYFGGLHPQIKNNYGIEANVSIAYLDYNSLFELYSELKPEFSPLNYYPKVTRDVNYKINDRIESIGELIHNLNKDFSSPILSSFETKFVDLYEDPNSKENYLTLRYIFQKNSGTLAESEVEEFLKAINSNLKEKTGLEERFKT